MYVIALLLALTLSTLGAVESSAEVDACSDVVDGGAECLSSSSFVQSHSKRTEIHHGRLADRVIVASDGQKGLAVSASDPNDTLPSPEPDTLPDHLDSDEEEERSAHEDGENEQRELSMLDIKHESGAQAQTEIRRLRALLLQKDHEIEQLRASLAEAERLCQDSSEQNETSLVQSEGLEGIAAQTDQEENSSLDSLGAWTSWSYCSQSCGGGKSYRQRTITNRRYDRYLRRYRTTTEVRKEDRQCNPQGCTACALANEITPADITIDTALVEFEQVESFKWECPQGYYYGWGPYTNGMVRASGGINPGSKNKHECARACLANPACEGFYMRNNQYGSCWVDRTHTADIDARCNRTADPADPAEQPYWFRWNKVADPTAQKAATAGLRASLPDRNGDYLRLPGLGWCADVEAREGTARYSANAADAKTLCDDDDNCVAIAYSPNKHWALIYTSSDSCQWGCDNHAWQADPTLIKQARWCCGQHYYSSFRCYVKTAKTNRHGSVTATTPIRLDNHGLVREPVAA